MERVLQQSWQWVRAWVPPGITAIALVVTMIGLWLVIMDPNRSLFAREDEVASPTRAERAQRADASVYRPAASSAASTSGSSDSNAAQAQATPGRAGSATECEAIRKEIDSVGVRVRSAGKSKQGVRFRTRLRELKALYAEECKYG